jgi:DNA-binding response OmpR family regulator
MSKPTVLIIEDSPYLAESVQDLLEIHNYQVHVAAHGQAGVAYALAHHPDLILLDIRLPDISGYEVYRQIRADKWGKHAAVTVLTASESLEEIAKNISLPLKYILFKPEQSLTDLLSHVQQRIGS